VVDTGLVRFIDVSSAFQHKLALDIEGRLWSWGNNEANRTGLGTTAGDTIVPTLINTGAVRFDTIYAGVNFSSAIDTTGRLWSWGSNSAGRTGLGTTGGNTPIPTLNNWSM
jgi:alpha-tubulin suppressor-like RCC1 family protein